MEDDGGEFRRRWSRTPLHALLGLQLVDGAPDDAITVTMPLGASCRGTTGGVHGGAIATLVDVTCGHAVFTAPAYERGQTRVVTVDLHVRYLRRPVGDEVRARARLVHPGRRLLVVECEVADGEGNLVAKADLSAMLIRVDESPTSPAESVDVPQGG